MTALLEVDLHGSIFHTTTIPTGLPLLDVWAQGLMLRGPNFINSVKTNFTHDTLQPQP